MPHYTEADGLVLCVIKGKKDIRRWISEIDAIDHSIISYKELLGAVNHLLDGKLVYWKNERFRLSARAKYILRGGLLMGVIDWQLNVRKRICKECYEESDKNTFVFSKEEYEAALKEYTDSVADLFS